MCVLFILLSRTDVTARPGVVSSYTAKRSVGVGYNFTRLTVFDKQNGQSGNQRLSRHVIARAAKEVARATVNTKDECEVDPVTSPSFGSFHTYVDVVDADFAEKGARCVKPFHFYGDPRVR